MGGSIQLYFVIGVINVFCTTLTILFVTHSLGNGGSNHQGCNFSPEYICKTFYNSVHDKDDIVAGSPVVPTQPTNGLQAGGAFHFLI